MATENQINYLNQLIGDRIGSLRLGAEGNRSAVSAYQRGKYTTKEERWNADYTSDAAEAIEKLRIYLAALTPAEMSKEQASATIDSLKKGTWIDEAIAN